MVGATESKISVLVLCNHLESVLPRNIDVGSNRPLRIESCRPVSRLVPVVSDAASDIFIELVGAFGKCPFAVKLVKAGFVGNVDGLTGTVSHPYWNPACG